jgi:hypothetical protein
MYCTFLLAGISARFGKRHRAKNTEYWNTRTQIMDGHCRVYNTDAFRDLVYSVEMEKLQQKASLESHSQNTLAGAGSRSLHSQASRTSAAGAHGGPSHGGPSQVGASQLNGEATLGSNRSSRQSLGMGSSRVSASGSQQSEDRSRREQARIELKTRRFKELQAVRDKQDEQQNKERMKGLAKKRERTFKYWMARVSDPKEREAIENVHSRLDLNDDEARRKLRAMHQDWEENVYGAISNDIMSQMESRDPAKSKRRIRREYQNYIDLTNKKGAIFRDIFIESEYDPNVLNRHTIKAKPKAFDDPTDRVIRRRKDELSMMSGGWVVKGDQTGGRETLDVQSWHTGKIESTPHGFAARFGMAPAPISDMQKKLSRSNVVMDQFNILTGDLGRAKLMAELGPGKKPVPGKRPDHKLW